MRTIVAVTSTFSKIPNRPLIPVPPPVPPQDDDANDCQTTDYFVNYVRDADVALNGDNGIQAGSNTILAWRILGHAYVLSVAISDTHQYETNGFKDDLTRDGQNGQVYQHVYGMAAATIANEGLAMPFGIPIRGGPIGETGAQLAARQLAEDQLQSKSGRPGDDNGLEAATEVRDDIAGIAVGNLKRDFRAKDSNDYEGLRKGIFGILCK